MLLVGGARYFVRNLITPMPKYAAGSLHPLTHPPNIIQSGMSATCNNISTIKFTCTCHIPILKYAGNYTNYWSFFSRCILTRYDHINPIQKYRGVYSTIQMKNPDKNGLYMYAWVIYDNVVSLSLSQHWTTFITCTVAYIIWHTRTMSPTKDSVKIRVIHAMTVCGIANTRKWQKGNI